MRSLTCLVTQVATLGAFARALPDRMPASPSAGMSLVNVRTIDRRGRPVMASIGPVGGGAGGEPAFDGSEGSGGITSFLKNTPVEINEAEVGVLFNGYGLARDSGGPGLHRGGNAVFMEFNVFAPQTMITARNRDRSIFACWGINGGRAGATSLFVRNPDAPNEEVLGNRDVILCEPGDVIRIVGPGAGGWGDPLLRDPEHVLRDIRAGFISPQAAEAHYGVVLRDGVVDMARTAERRRGAAMQPGAFDFGPGRSGYEAVWSAARYDALTRVLLGTEISWRHWVKKAIFAAVAAGDHANEGPAAQVTAIYSALKRRFPQLSAGDKKSTVR